MLKEMRKMRFTDLKDMLDKTEEMYKDRPAYKLKTEEGKYEVITHKEFRQQIKQLGTGLIDLGLKGERIAVISENRYEWSLAYLAIAAGTGIVVPLDKSLPANEIESLMIRSEVKAIFYSKKYDEIMEDIRQRGTTQVKYFISMDEESNTEKVYSEKDILKRGQELVINGDTRFIDTKINPEEMGIMLFTSGTTSISKAVMLSHKNIVENIYSLDCIVKVDQNDTSLAFLPFHHTFGWTGFLFFFKNGVTNAFCDGIRHIQENLKEYKVSIFVCVPLLLEAMYKKIITTIEKQGMTKKVMLGRKLSNILLKFGIDIRRKLFKQIIDQLGGNIRLAVSGAAGIDKEVAKGFNEFGIKAIQGYGLTETSPVITAENDQNIRYGSVGFPLENVTVKIDNPNEEGIGEIIAKGPNVMLGYYENEEATNEVLINGWFHTGDLGYFDKDRYLFITGRKKNVIVLKSGKNIYPEELELLINNLNYVQESMVFGYPKDDDLILSVKIVYNKELFEDLSEQEIYNKIWKDIKEINSRLTNYKHIKKLIITDEPMIKTTTQKVKRFEEIKKIEEESK